MADEQDFTGEVTGGDFPGSESAELESLLASFAPRAAGTSTARLLYLAGRESAAIDDTRGRHHRWLWPCCTAAMSIVAAMLAVLLAVRPERDIRIVEKPVPVVQPLPISPASSAAAEKPVRENKEDGWIDQAIDDTDVLPPMPHGREIGRKASPAAASYLRTRDLVLQHGFEAIPSFGPPGGAGREESHSMQELRTMLLRGVEKPAGEPRAKSTWSSFLFDGENL